MTRVTNWQEALEREITAARSRPFRWGVHDCCTFAAECARAITGTDYRGTLRWRSEADALRHLREAGGFSAALDARLPRVAGGAMMARAGDLVLARNSGRRLLTVCTGASLVAPGTDGLETIDISAGIAAWRVI